MKKKFKLLTSIASLGLALALGVFGVLAATNVTLTVNSTVQYQVGKSVIAAVEAGAHAQNSAAPAHATTTALTAFDGTESEPHTESQDLAGVTLDPTKTVAVYTFKITNNNEDTTTKLSVEVECAAVEGYTISYKDAATAVILAEESATISVLLTKTNVNASDADALDVVITVSLEQIAA